MKIINDPVFGFINVPNALLFDILEHRFFQRLAHIKQLGLSSCVYPGAQHTRFQHSLGAMHLTSEALKQLRSQGVDITNDEHDALLAAILLHDIGHGPFSHVLENTLIKGVSHEEISLMLMNQMNAEMGGRLDLAIEIFCDRYRKHFLHQLISSQLDMDRMDYLQRDSFFTGVGEGRIGADRIIRMLNVHNDRLVVAAKAIYSVENFLIARRFMYWQVYLHKTSVAAEKMLIQILRRAKELALACQPIFAQPDLAYFLTQHIDQQNFDEAALNRFVRLDDNDILAAIKVWSQHNDLVLSTLSQCFINRRLFKTEIREPLTVAEYNALADKYAAHFGISSDDARYFFETQTVSTRAYDRTDSQILMSSADGSVSDVTRVSGILASDFLNQHISKFYLCYFPIS